MIGVAHDTLAPSFHFLVERLQVDVLPESSKFTPFKGSELHGSLFALFYFFLVNLFAELLSLTLHAGKLFFRLSGRIFRLLG